MRILLDENMPRKLLAALVAEGHEVDSVKSLLLQGIDNGTLYQMAASDYDLCFTRDAEFASRTPVETSRALETRSRNHPSNTARRIRAAIPHRWNGSNTNQSLAHYRHIKQSNGQFAEDRVLPVTI